MLKAGQLEKLVISYLGGSVPFHLFLTLLACLLTLISNKYLEQMYLDGKMSLELVPQGTLVERMRAYAAGIPAFFTPTGASTTVETGGIPIRFKAGGFNDGVKIQGNKKEFRVFDDEKRYVLEPAIAGDVAFVHAWKADEAGNLVFRWVRDLHFSRRRSHVVLVRYVANNYNNVMARNAKLTIVEVYKDMMYLDRFPDMLHRLKRLCPSVHCRRTRFTALVSSSTGLSNVQSPSNLKFWLLPLRRLRVVRKIPKSSRARVAE